MSSVSNGLYILTLPLISIMRVIYRKIRHALYLYFKRNVEKSLGCALYIRCALSIENYGKLFKEIFRSDSLQGIWERIRLNPFILYLTTKYK